MPESNRCQKLSRLSDFVNVRKFRFFFSPLRFSFSKLSECLNFFLAIFFSQSKHFNTSQQQHYSVVVGCFMLHSQLASSCHGYFLFESPQLLLRIFFLCVHTYIFLNETLLPCFDFSLREIFVWRLAHAISVLKQKKKKFLLPSYSPYVSETQEEKRKAFGSFAWNLNWCFRWRKTFSWDLKFCQNEKWKQKNNIFSICIKIIKGNAINNQNEFTVEVKIFSTMKSYEFKCSDWKCFLSCEIIYTLRN